MKFAVLVCFAFLACVCEANTVIVLSWDGIRWDYLDRGEFPALQRMQEEGVRGKLKAVYPTKTFPTHVSMATGTYPDVHGIMDNEFWDPETRTAYRVANADWLQAEPIWIAAERQGIRTATYFWVGSESDWRGMGTSFRMHPFDGRRPESVKVAQYFEWLDLPEDERPHLIMSYWAGADRVGHAEGPDSKSVAAQLAAQDRELQVLLEGLDERDLWNETTLIIVSDHGMTEVSEVVGVQGALAEAGIDSILNGSTVAQIFLADPAQLDEAVGVIRRFEPVSVFRRDEIPQGWRLRHPTRSGDLIAVVDAPYVIGAEDAKLDRTRGTHGYAPARDDMHALLLAAGRGVNGTSEIVGVRQVDLAATIAALLGIEPPSHSEGQPMSWLDIE